jgi:8-oxo-dGTP pyrophosphatase MutT (NUDIX family)
MIPRPAATVMLLLPAPDGIGVYLIRRSSRSRFMPDAYVFPGGAVDASDGAGADAFAVAALRELFEEAGILIARTKDGAPAALDAETLDGLRAAVANGSALRPLLEARGLELDVGALTYYSNWITPESEPIRFDAHFFVARSPEGQNAVADATEVHDGIWISAAEALARADRDELIVRLPTRKHLERIARFPDVEAFLAHARARTVVPVMPYDDGVDAFALPGGADAW